MQEIRVNEKYRFGVPVHNAERKSPYCKTEMLYTHCDRAVSYHGRGDAITTHNRIYDRILSASSTAIYFPAVERKNIIPGRNLRLGDFYVPCWQLGTTAVFDVTMVSLLQQNSIAFAALKAGHAFEAAEVQERGTHQNSCS